MPRYGFSVEKSTLFRGVQQPFANVYYYDAPAVAVTAISDLETALNQIVDKEKEFHATTVNFKRGRVWNTASGSQQGNQMRVDKALSGTGARANVDFMDRERAVLLRIPAGFNVRGKPVYLRKWYHTCAHPEGTAIGNAVHGNTDTIPVAGRTYYEGKLNDIQELELLTQAQFFMCAQSGRQTTGEPQCHQYLEHHQLGDQWR